MRRRGSVLVRNPESERGMPKQTRGQPQRIDRGFTLVEIAVAVALIGMVLSIVVGSLAATTRSAQVYGDRLSVTMKGHIALQQIAATLRGCRKELGARNAQLRTVSTKPILDDTSAQAGLLDMAFRLDPIQRTLLVSQEPWRPGPARDTGLRTWVPLLEDVVTLEWSCWDGQTWNAEWDSKTRAGLPRLVRVEMELQDKAGRTYGFQTAVSPLCGAPVETTPVQGVHTP